MTTGTALDEARADRTFCCDVTDAVVRAGPETLHQGELPLEELARIEPRLAQIDEGVSARLDEASQLMQRLNAADATLQATCLLAGAQLEARASRPQAAESLLREAMRAIEAEGSEHRPICVKAITDLGGVYLRNNQPAAALRMAELAGLVHERNGRGDTSARLIARQNAAIALSAMGETRRALEQYELVLGRADEAEAAANEAVLQAAKVDRGTQALIGIFRTDVALERGDLDAAHALSRSSLDLAGYGSEQPERSLIRALLTAARVDLRAGAVMEAERHASDALKMSEALARGEDTSADVGEALLLLGKTRIARGSARDAQSLLERAARCLENALDQAHPLTREARELAGPRVAPAGCGPRATCLH